MEIRLLGVTEASVSGRSLALGAAQQRAVLAMLALEAGTPVPVDRLIEGLWGDGAPASANKMVQLYVSQLRRLLEGGGAEIITRGRGYELRLPADAVDARRFERLVEAGEAGAALALWRGTPLSDLLDLPFAAAETRRLEDLWIDARELEIEASLDAGRHREVVVELDELVAAHPLRERLHAQRMLALYRSGRQADALAAYQSAYRVLDESAGIEPGPELRRLHEAILHQDPSLDGPPAPERPRPPVRSRRRLWALAAAGLAVAAAAVAVIATAGEPVRVVPDSVVAVDAGTNEVVAAVGVGEAPGPLAVGTDAIWALNLSSETLSRIDLRTREMLGTQGTGGTPGNVAASPEQIWVSSGCTVGGAAGTLVAVYRDGTGDLLGGGEVSLTGVTPQHPDADLQAPPGCGLAAEGTTVWMAANLPPGIVRVDADPAAESGEVVWARGLPRAPTAIAAGAGAVWALDTAGAAIRRIDPETGRVERVLRAGARPVALVASDDAVWVASESDDAVYRIDPRTNAVAKTISVGDGPAGIAAGAGAVWVVTADGGTLERIDPATDRVTATIAIGHRPQAVAVTGSTVWVSVRGE